MELFARNLLTTIGEALKNRRESIAVAESVTSGLLQMAFASMHDAMQIFQGGLTAYNLAQKTRHLAVEPIHADSVNSVSQRVANGIAVNISNSFLSDWGIGITGYASPVPESGNKVYAYFAISYQGAIIHSERIEQKTIDAFKVQLNYADFVLEQLSWCLEK